jgi:hypothetical protein
LKTPFILGALVFEYLAIFPPGWWGGGIKIFQKGWLERCAREKSDRFYPELDTYEDSRPRDAM